MISLFMLLTLAAPASNRAAAMTTDSQTLTATTAKKKSSDVTDHSHLKIQSQFKSREIQSYLSRQIHQDLSEAYALGRTVAPQILSEPLNVIVFKERRQSGQYARVGKSHFIFIGVKDKPSPESTQHLRAALLHEFGHMVYQSYMIATSPEFRREMGNSTDSKVSLSFIAAFSPYDEFMADLFAVLATKSSNAGHPGHKRDFESMDDPYMHYKGDSVSSVTSPTGLDPHTLLNPLRAYVWDHFLKNTINDTSLLISFFKTTARSGRNIFKSQYLDYIAIEKYGEPVQPLSPTELNRLAMTLLSNEILVLTERPAPLKSLFVDSLGG